MTVVWTPAARDDLGAIRSYIENEDAHAARRVVRTILAATDRLPAHPAIGRPGRASGTRELVILRTPYIAAYRVHGGRVEILRVLHGARRWPDQF
jgi:toxin ParE1/3/4